MNKIKVSFCFYVHTDFVVLYCVFGYLYNNVFILIIFMSFCDYE